MFARPELTFPQDVSDFVTHSYREANVILEYGAGGSTVLAAETGTARCFSVESDRRWAAGLQTWLDRHVPGHGIVLHYANVGRTGDWGRPVPVRKMMSLRYAQYWRSVWNREDFLHPDLILIDGRFRVGCFLTAISRIRRKTKILFDDYTDRKQYHIVERFFVPASFVGRMAVFEAEPCHLRLSDWAIYARPALIP